MKPTPEQIEAAAKAIYEMVGYDMPVIPGPKQLPLRAAEAALTAAAEVVPKNDAICAAQWSSCLNRVAKEREACARVVDSFYKPYNARLIGAIVAAIKAMPLSQSSAECNNCEQDEGA